jgi:hypothetical protein
MIINPYLVQPSGPSYGTLTTAWIAATGETDLTILGALNTLESDLTTYGLTSKMKALYPFVGGTAAKHKYNFMDARDLDAAFRLTFSGGWTHSSNGALPNGTNAYADTKFNPTSALSSISSQHLSFYTPTNTGLDGRYDIAGYSNYPNEICALQSRNTSTTSVGYIGTFFSVINGSNTNFTGFFTVSRTSSTLMKLYRNSTSLGSYTANTTTSANCNLYIAAVSASNTFGGNQTDREARFASLGDGLTDTEAANLYTAVQAFQTTLSRQV